MKKLSTLALTTALLLSASAAQAAPFSLRLIGTHEIATGTQFQGAEFGGISGVDLAPNGNFYAISDDRGGNGSTPRFYELDIDYDQNAFNGVTILSKTNMLRPDGTPFPADRRTVDPEGIRTAPNGNLYWSSEGNFNTDPTQLFQPFVREMTPVGAFVREFNTPSLYHYVDGTTSGARNNKSFEALALAPDGHLFVANEDALVDDGPTTTLAGGSVVRVTKLDPTSGDPVAQYAYELPPIPVDAVPGAPFGPDNGLPELLAVDDNSFIALERAFAFGVGNTIRLVYTEILPTTTDILGTPSLQGATFEAMTREVLLEMPAVFQGITLDNMEAIAFGPTLAGGNRSLVVVSDNNFNPGQRTLFMAFEVEPIPLPAGIWLLLGGVGTFLALKRRKR